MSKRLIGLILLPFLHCSIPTVTELLVVSPHTPEIKMEFGLAFAEYQMNKYNRTVAIRWIDVGGTGEAIEYIKSRNSNRLPAGGLDCFFGGGDIPFITLENLGLLDTISLTDSLIANYPEFLNGVRLRSNANTWFGAALSGFGIVYNKALIEKKGIGVPTEWANLTNSEYKGALALGDPRYSGTIHMMFEIILQSYGWFAGWDILLKMAANARLFDKGASLTVKSVASGQAIAGISIDFYAAAEIEKLGSQKVGFVLPKGKTVVTPDGIAVLKGASQGGLARDFVRFVLTGGQKLWLQRKGSDAGPVQNSLCRMAADSSLYSKVAKEDQLFVPNPYKKDDNSFALDGKRTGKRWAVINDLCASMLISQHHLLQKIDTDSINAFNLLISESEVDSLAVHWTKKEFSAQRILIINEWTKKAEKRYLQWR